MTLARALEYRKGLEVTQQVRDVDELTEAVDRAAADVVLLDVNLPGVDGIEGLRRLRKRGLSTPVVVMSADKRNAELAEAADVRFFYKGTADLDGLIDEIIAVARPPRASSRRRR